MAVPITVIPMTEQKPAARRVLFVCGKCRQRSPTAAMVFANHPGWETDCAGLSSDAEVQLSNTQIEWATDIAVMEKAQIARLKRKYGNVVSGKRIISLDIPDRFEFMDRELIDLLRHHIGRVR